LPIRWRLTLLNALIIGVILLTLAASTTWLWRADLIAGVKNTTERQGEAAAEGLEEGEDLLGADQDELEALTADGTVIIVLRNAQGEVLGQEPKPPEKPDFNTGAGEIDDPVWKEVLKSGEPAHGTADRSSEGSDYNVYAMRVKPDPTFDVVLQSAGDKKGQVIKVVRTATHRKDLKSWEKAKALVDEAPKLDTKEATIRAGLSTDTANKLKAKLEEAGAKVELPPTITSSARVVEASKPYPSVRGILEDFAPVLATVGLLGFVLLVGGAYLLTRAALSPVEAVVRAAGEMSEGDLSRRLPVANPKDEIGRLTTTINALLARLEVAFTRLEETLSRLEETLSRQRRFAADASHELRTPLTSISGHARMLDEWALEGDKVTARRSVGTIRREAARMRGMIESLLTLSRRDEGAPMEVGRYNLGAVGKEATETAGAAADGRVSVEFVPMEHEVTATFDRERVMQVASILLDNAVKYTPDGGSVTVSVGEEDNGSVVLAVSDTGVGISEEQLPLVFERFYRADPSRSAGGAGLGLSIARQIAEAHGGQIRVESTPGKGSTFTLLLPRNGPGYLTSERPTEPSAE
jgi:signal transduction histidine kinase/ribosomal protein L7/L12